jgi:hypothetical protein
MLDRGATIATDERTTTKDKEKDQKKGVGRRTKINRKKTDNNFQANIRQYE